MTDQPLNIISILPKRYLDECINYVRENYPSSFQHEIQMDGDSVGTYPVVWFRNRSGRVGRVPLDHIPLSPDHYKE